jgi:hypothetical protein
LNKIKENKEIQGETKDNLTRGGTNKTIIIMDMIKTKGDQGWKKRSHSRYNTIHVAIEARHLQGICCTYNV